MTRINQEKESCRSLFHLKSLNFMYFLVHFCGVQTFIGVNVPDKEGETCTWNDVSSLGIVRRNAEQSAAGPSEGSNQILDSSSR